MIGADIMMQLDDVVSSVTVDPARFLEATHRSVRWLDRCIAAHARPKVRIYTHVHAGYITWTIAILYDINRSRICSPSSRAGWT